MSKFPFVFPRTVFVDRKGIVQQLEHMASEQKEASDELSNPDIFTLAVEVMDKYHSTETGLRILQEKYGVDLEAVRDAVIDKNLPRGYYASDPPHVCCLAPCRGASGKCPIDCPHNEHF